MGIIKLCPFCGCHDRRVGVRKMGKAGYKVICSRCGSSGPYVRIADFPDKMNAQEEAERAWNRRANDEADWCRWADWGQSWEWSSCDCGKMHTDRLWIGIDMNLQRTVRNMWRKVIMIKIFAGIGMGWVIYAAYILLKCSWKKFKRWRKNHEF